MRILTAVRERIVRPVARTDARDRYRQVDRLACRALVELSRDLSEQRRVTCLRELAHHLGCIASLRREAFGPEPLDERGAVDMAESLALSALLVLLVADAENAVTSATARSLTSTELEAHAGPVLERMAGTRDPEERGELLDDLYDAVVDVVGEQAADSIAGLPAPGHWESVTVGQWIDAVRAGSLKGLVDWRGLALAALPILGWMLLDGWLRILLGVAGIAMVAASFPRLRPNGRRWPLLLVGAGYGLVVASFSSAGRAEVLLVAAGAIAAVTAVAGWAWWSGRQR
ncbi:hypothetical protein AB0B10_26010 [Micromonospora arborensis]|uniref:hypothetical protein n=1 Tax=Micromonospora arborensis TaxID=2116518 RepID=UPI00340606E8